MTRRKRSRRALEAAAPEDRPAPEATVDPDVARFAARAREAEAARRDRKRAARAERDRAGEHQRLLAAKEAAAAEVKRLRTQAGATPDQTAAADAQYRTALADVIAFETGSAPSWAAEGEAQGSGDDADDLPPAEGDGAPTEQAD